MKKILIATTALVATAGVAAADVSLSGYGRFGFVYNDATDTTNEASRLRIQADMSTTTDSGIGINVRQRFQTEESNIGIGNQARFGLTFGDLAVNVGNINGVIESTPNLYMRSNSAGVGLEGNGFHSLALNNANTAFGWTAYSSGGVGTLNGVEAIYSSNGLRLHVHDTEFSTGYGASYSVNGVTAAVGYEKADTGEDALLLTASANIGAGWVAVAHGVTDDTLVETDKTSIKGGYEAAPGFDIYAFVASEDAGNASGIGMGYDLGGGASFDAGYTNTAAGAGILSAGIFFTF